MPPCRLPPLAHPPPCIPPVASCSPSHLLLLQLSSPYAIIDCIRDIFASSLLSIYGGARLPKVGGIRAGLATPEGGVPAKGVARGGGLGAGPQHTAAVFPMGREVGGAWLSWGWCRCHRQRSLLREDQGLLESLPCLAKEVWLFSSTEGLFGFWGDLCALGRPGWSGVPFRGVQQWTPREARGPSHPTAPGGRADLREAPVGET